MMNGFDVGALITAGTAVSVTACVKWAVTPLVIAFWAGLKTGKIVARREAARHARATAAR